MGGAVCVAIRKGQTEHIFEAWTNGFGYFLQHPSFRSGGAMYRKYISRGKRENEWPRTKIIDAIQSIEYGLVLIDLNYQHVFSRQGYSNPSRLLVSPFSGSEDIALARELVRAKHLSHFEHSIDGRDGTPNSPLPPTMKSLNALTAGEHFELFDAVLSPLVLYVNHRPDVPDKRTMEWAEQWARNRGWKSPFKHTADQDLRMAGDPPFKLKIKAKK